MAPASDFKEKFEKSKKQHARLLDEIKREDRKSQYDDPLFISPAPVPTGSSIEYVANLAGAGCAGNIRYKEDKYGGFYSLLAQGNEKTVNLRTYDAAVYAERSTPAIGLHISRKHTDPAFNKKAVRISDTIDVIGDATIVSLVNALLHRLSEQEEDNILSLSPEDFLKRVKEDQYLTAIYLI